MGISVTPKTSLFHLPLAVCLLFSILVSGCQPKEAQTYELILKSIEPDSGSYGGGTEIFLKGSGFKYIKSIEIGGEECTDLKIVDDSMATCTTPESSIGEAQVILTNTIGKTQVGVFSFENAPYLDTILPSIGPLSGGTFITISGSGFDPSATVIIGGSSCVGVVVVDPETIECTVPPHAAGYVVTTITNPDGKSVSGRLYSYRPEPTVTAVSPTGGNITGGSTVTIDGSGFSIGATVTIGGSNCNSVIVASSTRLTCITTAHAAGAGTISVTNTSGLAGTSLTPLYTYRSPPTVASITPNTRFAATTAAVAITGTGFLAGATVAIGGVPCTSVNVGSTTSITCTSGVGVNGAFDVVVTNTDLQSGTLAGGFTLVSAPLVTSINPTNGLAAGAESVTIAGNYFQAGATVSLGGSACNVTSQTTTQIICTTTAHAAGLVNVVVTNTDTQSGARANGFRYQSIPTVTSVAPSSGSSIGGTQVTVNGTGFYAGATVSFGGSTCNGVAVATNGLSLTCTTSAHADGGVAVTVTNADTQAGTSGAPVFTYQGAPTVTDVSPKRGTPSGGTSITVTGTNFFSGIQVRLGTQLCTAVFVSSTTSLTCFTPANAEGPITITVMNTDTQTGSRVGAFNYQAVMLDWDVTSYAYGDSTTDLYRTFTLTNSGENPSGTLTVTKTGTNPTAFTLINNTCVAPVAAGGTCTVDVLFPAASLGLNSYSANLVVTSALGYNTSSSLTGSSVDATLAWNFAVYDHGVVTGDDILIATLTNFGTDPTTLISTSHTGDTFPWTLASNTCNGAILAPAASCTISMTFLGSIYTGLWYTSILGASANAGGSASTTFNGYGD